MKQFHFKIGIVTNDKFPCNLHCIRKHGEYILSHFLHIPLDLSAQKFISLNESSISFQI